ncbi:putative tail tubular protein B [Pelagibacter phage Lederberg EXVC029P]|nr:putative tail tubular protein B [Pelagibacter phage Lederberg EXVC029P]
MARVAVQLTNFTGGELSPRLDGRNDLAKYPTGCKTLENFVVFPHGSAARRSGTQYVAQVKDSSKKTRLIPFEFSTTQTYMLEFGNQYIRFYKDDGQILESDVTISGATQADPVVITATAHGYSNGDEIRITSVVGMTELNNKRYKVANKTTNTFEITDVDGNDIDGTGFTAYTSGGKANRVYEISTPYLEAELFDIKFAQSADVMYITHPNHEVEKLSRTGHTSWTLADVEFIEGPFLDTNITTTTFTSSDQTPGTGRTITASSTTGINNDQGFLSTDVGRQIKVHDGWGVITAITSTTVVTVTIEEDFGTSNVVTNWSLGAFSDTTGHPSCVTFFEQRLVFAATLNNPQTIYFSKSGDYENFDENRTGTVADDDAIIYTIASNQVNAIRFMTATRTLIIGTAGGEFAVSGGGTDVAITPTNILIKKQSNHGAANVDAIPSGNATLFLQRAKRKLRELAYNFDVDGYVSPDLTILAEHITEGGLTQLSYQQEPNQIIWGVRGDGELVGLTYQREQQVVAWHRHIFGGVFGSGNTVCESVATIPTDDSEYQTWVINKRTIDGTTRRYVEYIHNFDFDETDDASFNFLDSQLEYDGSATSTISGLDHLEGETVSVLADGSTHPNKVVSSGSISLDRDASKVKVGLGYTSLLQTMRLDAGSQDGTSQGKTKRIFDIAIRLYESIGVEVGPDLQNMERVPFRSSADAMDEGLGVFTGDKEVEFRGNYETDGFIFVRQTQPLPLTILSLYPRLQTNDG